MVINKMTVYILIAFYEHNCDERKVLEDGDIYNLLMWDKIFVWFFSSPPADCKPLPSRHKKGSTDTRWDALLREQDGLKANAFVHRLFLRRKKYEHKTQKAA